MRTNIVTIDRIIRFLFALLVGILYLSDRITGSGAIFLGILVLFPFYRSLRLLKRKGKPKGAS